MQVEVTITHLEMTSPDDLRPKEAPCPGVLVARVRKPMPELNRFFYTAVGGDWHWTDRLSWTYARWLEFLDRPEVETWVQTVQGIPAGYFELERQPQEQIEVAYFGMLPQFIGQGLGGHLLTAAVRRGWELGARRVWLHTCTLDHPTALGHYLARGFRAFRKEVELRDISGKPPGPWPGGR
jgi:GNAT superfamily N-acetyltransferase